MFDTGAGCFTPVARIAFSLAGGDRVPSGVESLCRARALSRKIFASETPVVREGRFYDVPRSIES